MKTNGINRIVTKEVLEHSIELQKLFENARYKYDHPANIFQRLYEKINLFAGKLFI